MIVNITFRDATNTMCNLERDLVTDAFPQGIVYDYEFGGIHAIKFTGDTTDYLQWGTRAETYVMGLPITDIQSYAKIDRLLTIESKLVYCEEYYCQLPHQSHYQCYAVRISKKDDSGHISSVTYSIISACKQINSQLNNIAFDSTISLYDFIISHMSYHMRQAMSSSAGIVDAEPIMYAAISVVGVLDMGDNDRFMKKFIERYDEEILASGYLDYISSLNGNRPNLDYLVSMAKLTNNNQYGVFINHPYIHKNLAYINDCRFYFVLDFSNQIFASDIHVDFDWNKNLTIYTYNDLRVHYLENSNVSSLVRLEHLFEEIYNAILINIETVHHHDTYMMKFIKTSNEEIFIYFIDKNNNNNVLIYYDLFRLNLRCANVLTEHTAW